MFQEKLAQVKEFIENNKAALVKGVAVVGGALIGVIVVAIVANQQPLLGEDLIEDLETDEDDDLTEDDEA